MRRFLSIIFVTATLFSVRLLAAQEFPDALQPPNVLKPLPPEFGDDKRLFQGIPSFTLSPGGRLWATWYSGGTTEGDENYVLLATSGDNGNTWTKPLFAVDIPGPVRAYDPAMWTDPNGNVWLFWAQSFHHWDGRSGVWCITTENGDAEDAVWSKPRRLCDGIMMGKPIADSKGRWLLPVSLWPYDPKKIRPETMLPPGANVVGSEDQGKTWKYFGHALVPGKDATCDEHMIYERMDGSFDMLIRARYGIAEATSTDGCKTWTEPKPSTIAHPAARFFVRRLQSGNLLLVKHGPMNESSKRDRLTAFLSEDDGKTWTGGLVLDERNGVSYPDGDQAKDGTIYVIYDYRRTVDKEILLAKFTEEDIRNGKMDSPNGALRLLVNKSTAPPPPPRPDRFKPNPNKDGKPLRSGPSPEFDLKGNELDEFKTGVKLFGNRDYKANTLPKELHGKKIVRGSMENVEILCKKEGTVIVLTPTKARNKDSVAEELLNNGFEKVALPEILIFGNAEGNMVTAFQKTVKPDEIVRFGKWGVLVY